MLYTSRIILDNKLQLLSGMIYQNVQPIEGWRTREALYPRALEFEPLEDWHGIQTGDHWKAVYDHTRFKAEDILGMIERYRITSLCAPPTVFRFLIQEIKYVFVQGLHSISPFKRFLYKYDTCFEEHMSSPFRETMPKKETGAYHAPVS